MNKFMFAGRITFMKQYPNTNSYLFGIALTGGNAQNPQYASVFMKQDAKDVDFAGAEVGADISVRGYVSNVKKDDGTTTTYFNGTDAWFMPSAKTAAMNKAASATTTKTASKPTETPKSQWVKKKEETEPEVSLEDFFSDETPQF